MHQDPLPLESARREYRPRMPRVLRLGPAAVDLDERPAAVAVRDADEVRRRFPHSSGRPLLRLVEGRAPGAPRPLSLGVVLSGGQAPGGHNVIAGLLDALLSIHGGSRLVGFLGGPKGILAGAHVELDLATVAPYRNAGGFDLLGAGRDKIETAEQLAACRATCERLRLDGLVVVGGDDSNTNAATLAEDFLARRVPVTVNGVPKTIDGDLGGEHLELSFGFDTATRVYSELIGNICRDAKSAGKYWHFIKLMGRSASHVALECALQTRANVALIGEEIDERGMTGEDVADHVAGVIRRRAEAGRNYGVCLIPEGLIEFVPAVRGLIAELNGLLASESAPLAELASMTEKRAHVARRLGDAGRRTFDAVPERIQHQLLLDRDAHGNVQVSKIDTEQWLAALVERRLEEARARGEFRGKFQVQHHFLGYEGRCSYPTNFDADYTYTLGALAALLAAFDRTGYLCSVVGLAGPVEDWQPVGVPLTSMMQVETRKGRPTPVIGKTLVETSSAAFREFAASRASWEDGDAYAYPGPIQYFGPPELTDVRPRTLVLGRAAER